MLKMRISNKEVLNKYLEGYNSLTGVKKADCEYSLSWKKNCKYLFDFYQDNKEGFKKAIKWCGNTSGVSRTITIKDFDYFSSYIFNNLSNFE